MSPVRCNSNPRRLVTLLAASLSLAGCTSLAPESVRPALPVPSQLPASAVAGQASSSGEVTPMSWREFVVDNRLRQVVDLALDNNRDLRIAAQNIERARAQYRVTRAELFPSVQVGAAVSRQQSRSASQQPGVSTGYSVELGFSGYELDFFGRVRNLGTAALESYFATEEARRSAQISLVAEVATAWLTLAADRDRLQLACDTLLIQQRAQELSRRMQELGAISGLALAQAQTTVDSARLDVARYTSQVALDVNALSLLAGVPVDASLWPDAGVQAASVLVGVPAGLSSEVLLERPDVLSAEHTLRASNADIGVARAAFFPRIALTAQAGRASGSLGALFGAGNGVWSWGPSLSLPLFDAGARRAEVEAAQAQQRIDVASYEKTVQVAFREVADALAERAGLDEQQAAQQSLLAATQKSLDLSTALFKNGASGYLEVLDAQRSLYAARQSSISLRLSEQVNRVTLYKVLGGGGY